MPEENQPPAGDQPPQMSAIDRASADMDAVVPQTPPPEPKPDAGVQADPKPDAKPDAKPGQQKPPTSTPEESDEAKFEKEIKPNAKAWRVYEGVKKSWSSERQQLQAKVKELEAKASQTPADDKRIKEMEERIAEIDGQRKKYEETIAELDYTRSPEYQQKFVARWQRTYKEAADFVKRIQIGDEVEGNKRAATQADFEAVRNASPERRRAVAREIFGDSAPDVVDYIRELDKIRLEADAEVENQKVNRDRIVKERAQKAGEETKGYTRARDEARTALEGRYPHLFSPGHYKDNPELQKKLEEGYAYVDQTTDKSSSMSVDERAATASVVRARAAAFPLLYTQLTSANTKIEELTKELEKFRASGPGAGAGSTGTPPAPTGAKGGIEAMAEEFNK